MIAHEIAPLAHSLWSATANPMPPCPPLVGEAGAEVAIETGAGRFSGCVRVVEEGAPSGAVVRTTYCPDVGPVEVESRIVLDHGAVQVIARLRGYRIGGEPIEPNPVKSN